MQSSHDNPYASPLDSSKGAERFRYKDAFKFHLNAYFWAVGATVLSTNLVLFWAESLSASSLSTSWLIASSSIAGILQIFIASFQSRIRSFRRFSILTYIISVFIILTIPIGLAVSITGLRITIPVWLLVTTWCIYHIFEYLGTVSLISWIGIRIPNVLRGRFFGIREGYLVAGRISGMFISLALTHFGDSIYGDKSENTFLVLALLGSFFLGLAIIPLFYTRRIEKTNHHSTDLSWKHFMNPLKDRKFRPFLYFLIWFGFFNGITQVFQFRYIFQMLGSNSFLKYQALLAVMLFGQIGCSRYVGGQMDRWKTVPMMIISQIFVGLGLVSLAFVSRPDSLSDLFFSSNATILPWLFWIGYVGLNIGIPNLTTKLAPQGEYLAYVSTAKSVSSLAFVLSAVLGGVLFEFVLTRFAFSSDIYQNTSTRVVVSLIFVIGGFFRVAGCLLLRRIPEESNVEKVIEADA